LRFSLFLNTGFTISPPSNSQLPSPDFGLRAFGLQLAASCSVNLTTENTEETQSTAECFLAFGFGLAACSLQLLTSDFPLATFHFPPPQKYRSSAKTYRSSANSYRTIINQNNFIFLI
jgi:hypothetical protein